MKKTLFTIMALLSALLLPAQTESMVIHHTDSRCDTISLHEIGFIDFINTTPNEGYELTGILSTDYATVLQYSQDRGGGYLLKNGNVYTVYEGVQYYPLLVLEKDTHIEYVFTYHWNMIYCGDVNEVSVILLNKETGGEVVRWAQTPSDGQWNRSKANWTVFTHSYLLPAGTYEVHSTHEASWSCNYTSNYTGFCEIIGW